MSIGLRIRELRNKKGLSQIEFANKIGVKQSPLSQMESGKILPSIETLSNIIRIFNISYSWLIDGVENETKSEENVIQKKYDNNYDKKYDKPKVKKMSYNEPEEEKVYPMYSEHEYRAVMRKIKFAEGVSLADEGAPFYPLPVSAGNAMQLLEEEEKPTGFLSIPGVYCKAYFPVIGFSFEPIIRAGDVIGIDFINRWEMLDPDCIYFIITHDQRMIKRLSDDPDNPDRLICISPNHKEFPIYKSEIKAIHKVIFYGRLV